MMRPNLCIAALLASFMLAAPAAANDTVASMGAGGLVFQRTDGIEMRSEDLYVSAREIRVRYRFFNRTDRDIGTLVAFTTLQGLSEHTVGALLGCGDQVPEGPVLVMLGEVFRDEMQARASSTSSENARRIQVSAA